MMMMMMMTTIYYHFFFCDLSWITAAWVTAIISLHEAGHTSDAALGELELEVAPAVLLHDALQPLDLLVLHRAGPAVGMVAVDLLVAPHHPLKLSNALEVENLGAQRTYRVIADI
jgi:hypothetical protein